MSMLGLKVYYDENKPLVVQQAPNPSKFVKCQRKYSGYLNNMLYVDMKASRALTRCAALK